jgi:hypothetical protein
VDGLRVTAPEQSDPAYRPDSNVGALSMSEVIPHRHGHRALKSGTATRSETTERRSFTPTPGSSDRVLRRRLGKMIGRACELVAPHLPAVLKL